MSLLSHWNGELAEAFLACGEAEERLKEGMTSAQRDLLMAYWKAERAYRDQQAYLAFQLGLAQEREHPGEWEL